MKKKTPNSKRLQLILDKWPDLSKAGIAVMTYDISARMAVEDLIKALERDEQIAKELEEINQLKFL